jgi:hypothetical protein
MSASTERAKWTSGAPSRAIPDGVIRFSSILASAGWSGHGWCTTVDQAAIALGEKPVALDEKMLERVPVRPRRRPARLVGRRERRAQPSAPVVDPAVSGRSRHRRDVIVEPVQVSADRREERARGVEAEKPDPGDIVDPDVGADVQLRDRPQRRPARRLREPGSDHHESDNRKLGCPVADVRLDAGGQQSVHLLPLHRPVGKQEVVPPLADEPPSGYHVAISP